MSNDYVIIYLINGEEVVGKVLRETDKGIDLADALMINVSMIDDGPPVFYFGKYCSYVSSFDIYLKKEHIMNIFRDPLHPLIDHYERTLNKFKQISENFLTKENIIDDDEVYSAVDEDEYMDEFPDNHNKKTVH